jgi:hypothetical protein
VIPSCGGLLVELPTCITTHLTPVHLALVVSKGMAFTETLDSFDSNLFSHLDLVLGFNACPVNSCLPTPSPSLVWAGFQQHKASPRLTGTEYIV